MYSHERLLVSECFAVNSAVCTHSARTSDALMYSICHLKYIQRHTTDIKQVFIALLVKSQQKLISVVKCLRPVV